MFTRAGFKPNHSVICVARVRLLGRDGESASARSYPARLIRFYPSGDLAWYSRSGSFLVWGERVSIVAGPLAFSFPSADHGELRAVNIESFHRKLEAAREAGCLAVAA